MGLRPGCRAAVTRRPGVDEDLLKRIPVDVELAADRALALALGEDATANLSPVLHVREHPSASKRGPVKVNRTFILASSARR